MADPVETFREFLAQMERAAQESKNHTVVVTLELVRMLQAQLAELA